MVSPGRRRRLILLASAILLVGIYWGGMRLAGRSPHLNFEVVDPDRLLRCAQPRAGDLDRILRTHGIGTIISLRGDEEPEVKEWATQNNIPRVTLKMKADDPPTDGQIGIFFDIMRGDPVVVDAYRDVFVWLSGLDQAPVFVFPHPVLIHCEGGADRTGVMVALYRMAFQGWDVKLAEQDMAGRGHISPLHPRQFEFLERIAPKINPYYGSRGGRLTQVPAAPVPTPAAPSSVNQPAVPGAP